MDRTPRPEHTGPDRTRARRDAAFLRRARRADHPPGRWPARTRGAAGRPGRLAGAQPPGLSRDVLRRRQGGGRHRSGQPPPRADRGHGTDLAVRAEGRRRARRRRAGAPARRRHPPRRGWRRPRREGPRGTHRRLVPRTDRRAQRARRALPAATHLRDDGAASGRDADARQRARERREPAVGRGLPQRRHHRRHRPVLPDRRHGGERAPGPVQGGHRRGAGRLPIPRRSSASSRTSG